MDIRQTIRSFERKGYTVQVFENASDAADYLDRVIDGKVVGMGDSKTMIAMHLYERLSRHNTVYDPHQTASEPEFLVTAKQSLGTEVYLTSVNAASEWGELVNLDSSGNRLAGAMFGHEKVYFVFGVNKVEKDLQTAVWRARNVAAPMNALKYDLPTPCVHHYKKTGNLKCFDCSIPERICNGLMVYLRKMHDVEMEIILIKEELGF